ncbi:hypothetical protein U1Q18_003695 [Sarracenia purpurea var. burkii]
MEKRYAGIRAITIQGLNAGTLDITLNTWGHEVGVKGEKLQLYTKEGLQKVQWSPAKESGPPLTWYQTYFDAPEGNSPVALGMSTMGKGMVWVNGQSIGRYWVNYLSPLGQPTQSEYHIPRAFIKPGKNLLVVFEETGGNPEGIEVLLVNRDTICSFVSEDHPPSVKAWKKDGEQIQEVVDDANYGARLTCPEGKTIKVIEFASFGDPFGACGSFAEGNCTSPNSKKIVEQHCLGKNSCSIPVERTAFDKKKSDQCPDISKTLAVQVRCGHGDSN